MRDKRLFSAALGRLVPLKVTTKAIRWLSVLLSAELACAHGAAWPHPLGWLNVRPERLRHGSAARLPM